jgi:hypothetical protein
VTADVHRAAQLIDAGLSSFAAVDRGFARREGSATRVGQRPGTGAASAVLDHC